MYRVSNDLAEFDLDGVHRFLSEDAYWSKGLPRAVFDRALANSLCFGGFLGAAQVAFGRVITDRRHLPTWRTYSCCRHTADAVIQRHWWKR